MVISFKYLFYTGDILPSIERFHLDVGQFEWNFMRKCEK
jgi:hypothetical protein